MTDLDHSNSLADLAARIKAEHQATSDALKSSVEHGIAAGLLLIEAKAQVQHGQWLPWLKDHCAISERTAQLYMRLGKNREAIEEQIRNGVADLTLNEAAALLMMSSDVRKLLAFAETAASLSGEELVEFCIANDVAVLQGDIFGAKEPTDTEWVEWGLFVLFLAKRCGFSVEGAAAHMDWVQSRGTLLRDWMGEFGKNFPGMKIAQTTIDSWNAFLADNQGRTFDEVTVELDRLRKEDDEWQAKRRTAREKRRRRRAAMAA